MRIKDIYECPVNSNHDLTNKGFSNNGKKRQMFCEDCGKYYRLDIKNEDVKYNNLTNNENKIEKQNKKKIDTNLKKYIGLHCIKCGSKKLYPYDITSNTKKYKCKNCNHIITLKPEKEKENKDKSSASIDEKTGNIIIDSSRFRPLTKDEQEKFYDIDTKYYECVRLDPNNWDMTNANGETYTNYQLSGVYKKRSELWKADNVIEFLKNKAYNHKPKFKDEYFDLDIDITAENLLEMILFDVHYNKLSYGIETGDEVNNEIIYDRFIDSIKDGISKAGKFGFNKILFPIGNDFFNTDFTDGSKQGYTTKGTQQDVDDLWMQSFVTGFNLLVHGIDYMRQYAPVDIVVVPGNHDEKKMFTIAHSLKWFYQNVNSVSIELPYRSRAFRKYGMNLLGFSHQTKISDKDIPIMMAQESGMWDSTIFRELHLAHNHRDTKKNISLDSKIGMKIRTFDALSGTDKWTYSTGKIGKIKGGTTMLWNKDNGLFSIFKNNITVDNSILENQNGKDIS